MFYTNNIDCYMGYKQYNNILTNITEKNNSYICWNT